MKVAVFSTKSYDRQFLEAVNAGYRHDLVFFEPRLTRATASLAQGFPTVCVFVNDELDADAIALLAAGGTRLVATRSAGFNHIDLDAAERAGMAVVRVPAYSPHAVAEHTVALLLALARRIYRAYNRVHEGNFSLEGLLGLDICGKTVGIVGTGRIGAIVARIMHGFGCEILAHDVRPNPDCAECVRYVSLDELLARSDIVTLHCPLTPETHHLIDAGAVSRMKDGVLLLNTSRGPIIDSLAVIEGLKSGKIGYLGLDVYEEEEELFFQDLSDRIIQDDVFARLEVFPNVVITGHQAFFTHDAMTNIAETTLANIRDYETTGACPNLVATQKVAG